MLTCQSDLMDDSFPLLRKGMISVFFPFLWFQKATIRSTFFLFSVFFPQSECYLTFTHAAAKSLQLCLTLCDPIDGSPRGSPIPGILQARTLEWVAISFSNAWKWKVKVKSFNRVRLLATPQTAAYQAPLSVGFSRQEYWSGVPLPSLVCVCVYIYKKLYSYISLYK